jgi:hypothetical protein
MGMGGHGPIPDLPGIGGPMDPHPHPRFAGDRGWSPVSDSHRARGFRALAGTFSQALETGAAAEAEAEGLS